MTGDIGIVAPPASALRQSLTNPLDTLSIFLVAGYQNGLFVPFEGQFQIGLGSVERDISDLSV